VNYVKLLEMNSFFTLHCFLEVGKTQDLPSKFWQTLVDTLRAQKCNAYYMVALLLLLPTCNARPSTAAARGDSTARGG
jgi:hypothetical protein